MGRDELLSLIFITGLTSVDTARKAGTGRLILGGAGAILVHCLIKKFCSQFDHQRIRQQNGHVDMLLNNIRMAALVANAV